MLYKHITELYKCQRKQNNKQNNEEDEQNIAGT